MLSGPPDEGHRRPDGRAHGRGGYERILGQGNPKIKFHDDNLDLRKVYLNERRGADSELSRFN
jgi:hypothetical protein